jgi:hypothetical protein
MGVKKKIAVPKTTVAKVPSKYTLSKYLTLQTNDQSLNTALS